ncbi:MAG: helix-turn-helix transcriptional regulator [Oscillospiraceae bacterium]|nr:helix-turn-helix transcriptional regulator [Oscillospiraceae bacterium]
MREWLLKLRRDQGLTLKVAASKLGVSESYYSLIEKGIRQQRLDMALAEKISKLFDVSLDYIAEQDRAVHEKASQSST